MPLHPLINFEIKVYYQSDVQLSLKNEPKFDGFYSRNNFPKIKDEAYVINIDEYESVGTHWIALFVNANNIVYFDRFRVEHIPRDEGMDEAYVITVDEYESVGTHCTALYVNANNFPKEILTNTSYHIFIEQKDTIRQCVDTFA